MFASVASHGQTERGTAWFIVGFLRSESERRQTLRSLQNTSWFDYAPSETTGRKQNDKSVQENVVCSSADELFSLLHCHPTREQVLSCQAMLLHPFLGWVLSLTSIGCEPPPKQQIDSQGGCFLAFCQETFFSFMASKRSQVCWYRWLSHSTRPQSLHQKVSLATNIRSQPQHFG